MAAFAQQLIDLKAAPESFDPEDVEGDVDDGTTAGRRRRPKSTQAINLEHDGKQAPSKKNRLQMRQTLPVLPKYAGKRVDRKEIFGNGEVDADSDAATGDLGEGGDEDDEDDSEDLGGDDMVAESVGDLGNFSISGDLDKEYEKMMKKSESELSVMRAPSASELAKKEAEAKQLKQLVASWGTLVEFRIHLESALSIAHRLPVGNAFEASRDAGGEALAKEASSVDSEACQLLGTLMDLQHNLSQRRGIPSTTFDDALRMLQKKTGAGREEAESWALVDAQLQPLMDWGLGVADEWKERTRLDTRRSFKVLDQSLSSQMRAASEVEPEKLRRRCTPPAGRHQVFGASNQPVAPSGAKDGAGGSGAAEEERDIFDDRDFYVQLLRESLASGDRQAASEETREMQMELQGRRASKKRNRADVERRASKGRKIRYVPIEKLQNFVASRPRSSI